MVTIGTWNLENLFRPGEGDGPRSDEAYQAKLDALAVTIIALEPDVLGVQEVGQPEALDELAVRAGGRWHVELAEPDGRGIRVGFLSRLPLSGAEQVGDFPERLAPVQVNDDGDGVTAMGRPALRVRVDAAGAELTLVCCHLKSKLLTYPGGRFTSRDEDERARYAVYALHRRAAESATVRGFATRLLNGQGRQRALVVLDDLNDETHAATTFLLQGPPGSEIGTPGYDRPDQGDGARLWNRAPLIPADKRHSRTYNCPARTHRPHPGQPRPARPARRGHHRRRTDPLGHRRTHRAPRRTRLRPPTGPRPPHPLAPLPAQPSVAVTTEVRLGCSPRASRTATMSRHPQ